MDITIGVDALDRKPDDDQLGRMSFEFAAFDGEVGDSAGPIDDPEAVDEYVSGTRYLLLEDGTVLLDGFVLLRDQERGATPVVNRQVLYSVQDPNALLYARRFVQTRPRETDVQRVLARAAIDLPGVDTSMVLNVLPVTMDLKTYATDGWGELIDDLVNLTGKTLFIHDKAVGGRCLHYHSLTTGHVSTLSIDDTPGVADGITIFAPGTPVRTPTGADLANDLLVRDQNNRTATASDGSSISLYDAYGLAHQRFLEVEAGSQAELNLIATNLLAEGKDEHTTYEVTIGPLDGTALAQIRVGDYISTTSQALGLSSSGQRIAHMTLTPFQALTGPVPGLWDARLELGYPIRRGRIRFRGLKPDRPPVPDGVTDCGAPLIGDFEQATWGQYYAPNTPVAVGTGSPQVVTLPYPYVLGTLRVESLSIRLDMSLFDAAAGEVTVTAGNGDDIYATWRLPTRPSDVDCIEALCPDGAWTDPVSAVRTDLGWFTPDDFTACTPPVLVAAGDFFACDVTGDLQTGQRQEFVGPDVNYRVGKAIVTFTLPTGTQAVKIRGDMYAAVVNVSGALDGASITEWTVGYKLSRIVWDPTEGPAIGWDATPEVLFEGSGLVPPNEPASDRSFITTLETTLYNMTGETQLQLMIENTNTQGLYDAGVRNYQLTDWDLGGTGIDTAFAAVAFPTTGGDTYIISCYVCP